MRVLVVGGGGREHALVHSFAQSPLAERIFCAPGNAGTAAEADNIPISADDLPGLLDFASRENVDLTVDRPRGAARDRTHRPVRGARPRRVRPQPQGRAARGQQGVRQGDHGRRRRRDRRLPAAHRSRHGARRRGGPRGLPAGRQGRRPGRRQGRADLQGQGRGARGGRGLLRRARVRRGRRRAHHRGVPHRLRGLAAGALRRRDGRAARAGAGLQAHLRRRPGAQHRRHGQLLPGAGVRAEGHRRSHGPGGRARRGGAPPPRRQLPRRAVRRPHRRRGRHQGARVQLPLRRPGDAGGAAAAGQ